MADKISTVVLKVDLGCERCYKKIRKAICKIQDKSNIKTISFDEKSNAVTVSGPFDPDKVCRKLCCKAGRVIKETQIKGKEGEPKDGGDKPKAAKPAGKPENKDGGKPEKEAKADKDAAKPDKEKAKDATSDKEKAKDAKPEKKVRFELDDAPAADAKPEKAKQAPEPIAPPMMMMMPPVPTAQGVAVPSIWPAPAGSVPYYSYNPAYDQSSYYGVPVYDHQGWYYGNRHPYYQQQQPCYEDPNAGCSVM